MISFDLCCSKGHRFEGWFSSSSDFDHQQQSALVACPICDDSVVQKLLSVPNIGRKGNQPVRAEISRVAAARSETVTTIDGHVANAPVLPADMTEIMQKMAMAQSEMLKNSEWVGPQFAETARAIHYGESDGRLIHGEASRQEAEALAEEGVLIARLPFPYIPPEAKN